MTAPSAAGKWRRRSWDELRVRALQEFSKRWDSFIYPHLPGARANGGSALQTGRFFFQPSELKSIIAAIRQNLPSAIEETLARAERICRHRFDLLGYEDLDYGEGQIIDWHLDAVSGRRAPPAPFYKVRYLDYSAVGDAKVIWELNRHHHLVTLAKAYCFTSEMRFFSELISQWQSWRQQNPYPVGINWASSLEVSFRCLSWLWMRELLRASLPNSAPGFDSFQAELDDALLVAGRHVERYLSTYFSPNTHLLGEAVALFFLGMLCANSPQTKRWRERGWKIILQEAQRQVRADGLHFEQSTYYHVYALDFCLHARLLAAANEIAIPTEFDAAIRRMLRALAIMGAMGTPPRFGDDDGGRVFDPRRNRSQHMLDPLSTGAAVYGCSNYKLPQLKLVEETIWLFGPAAVARFADLPAGSLPCKSVAFKESGLYILLSTATEDAQPGQFPIESSPAPQPLCEDGLNEQAGDLSTPSSQLPTRNSFALAIDAGPQGALGAGHGHADALSLQVAINGEIVLIDPGTYVYVGPANEREQFRGTPAHNTVSVDGMSQSEPGAGPFPWRSLPNVAVENWICGQTFEYLCARHDGYRRLAEPAMHQRHILFLRGYLCLIVDFIEGKGVHDVEIVWQWAQKAGNHPSLVLLEDSSWTTAELDSWCSPAYGCRESSSRIAIRYHEQIPASFATVLLASATRVALPPAAESGLRSPESTAAGGECRLHRIAGIGGSAEALVVQAFEFVLANQRHRFFLASGMGRWSWRGIETDARLIYGRSNSPGTENAAGSLVVCAIKYLRVDGEVLLDSADLVNCIESSLAPGAPSSTAPNRRHLVKRLHLALLEEGSREQKF